jgi:diadenylate cyclase
MSDLLDLLRDNFEQFDASAGLDVFLIWISLFWILLLLRNTTAMTVIRGATILLIAAFILGRVFDLRVLNFLLRNSIVGLIVGIFVIFTPEIRRALERIGRTASRAFGGPVIYERSLDAVSAAALEMSRRKIGALIVMERETGLQEYTEHGVAIDGMPSPELLANIFYPNSPLHDGAVILRGDRVIAACVTLPLSDNALPGDLGTRHRAGLGITERTDAVSVMVSEQTGEIAVAADGRIFTRLDEARMRGLLDRLLGARNGHGELP